MKKISKNTLGFKLTAVQAITVFVVMWVFTIALTTLINNRIEQRAEKELSLQTQLLVNSISNYNSALANSTEKLGNMFRSYFPGKFSLEQSTLVSIGEKQTPVLRNGYTTLNLNNKLVDRFAAMTKSPGTVFVRMGDDFTRIATSLEKEDGSRAVGTALDRSNAAYGALLKGEEHTGKTPLFGKEYMTKYMPIKDGNGKVIGALFVGHEFTDSLTLLKASIRKLKIGRSGYFYALDAREGDSKGVLQIHPDKEGSSIIDSKDSEGHEFIKEILKRKDGVIRYPWINKEAGETSSRMKLASFHYLKEWNWVIAGGAYLDELSADGRILRNAMLGATALVIVILVMLFMFMVRHWITQPLQASLAITEQLASGDFRNVSPVDTDAEKSFDEVEELSRGIRRMGSSLRKLLDRINCSSREVSTAAEQVNSNSEHIATGAEEVAAQAVTIATASEEMSATSGDIALNCQLAAESAERASKSARNGAEVVDMTVAVMERIAEKVREAARTIENLGVRSDQIGAIIGTIEDIADQTNLLALNAAIEAARAGERGRGFAVVADEVRALAERTTKATKEISDMIKTIQQETMWAVAAMEQGVFQVEEGTMEAAKSGEALCDILEHVNAVSMQVSQIATAAGEQTATTGEISSNMHQITQVVHDTAIGAHHSATAAARLKGNAEELQSLVRQFRL